MGITSDRNDPELITIGPDGQQRSYLVLTDAERARGFARPVRRTLVWDHGYGFVTVKELGQ